MRYDKIAPSLLTALDDFAHAGNTGLRRHARAMGVVATESQKPPRVAVFLRCDETSNLDHLTALGVKLNQRHGSVRTAFMPVASVDVVSDDPEIRQIVPSRRLKPLMDAASSAVHVQDLRQTGLTGKQTIVGVVDSGIDPNHPAFQGRILRIWDQTIDGPGVLEGDYGLELTGPALVASRDRNGHGTHVAGIAAGQDATFGGVAPDASLVIVKTDMQDAHIADGVRYVFRAAAEMNRPAVVNLSLGGHFDAHDGSDPLSQIIDQESGPGRIVCCAAGNEGTDNIHGEVSVKGGQTKSLSFHVPASTSADPILTGTFSGWYEGADRIEVAVSSPAGFTTPFQAVITSGNPVGTFILPDGRVQIVTPGPSPDNGDHQFLVQVSSASGPAAPVTAGTWRIRLRGVQGSSGTVHVWALDEDVLFTKANDSMKIGSPGAAASAITVASYTTKVQFTNIDGQVQQVGLELNDISSFSSPGPLRTGAQKPDVAAPGAMIASCLSADAAVRRGSMISSRFVMMAGTSMATPFVSGLVALLLESNALMTPAQAKATLRTAAAIPNGPQGVFDRQWGFGLIDAAQLVAAPV